MHAQKIYIYFKDQFMKLFYLVWSFVEFGWYSEWLSGHFLNTINHLKLFFVFVPFSRMPWTLTRYQLFGLVCYRAQVVRFSLHFETFDWHMFILSHWIWLCPLFQQCRSRSAGFFRSQLIWIYTVSIQSMNASFVINWIIYSIDLDKQTFWL